MGMCTRFAIRGDFLIHLTRLLSTFVLLNLTHESKTKIEPLIFFSSYYLHALLPRTDAFEKSPNKQTRIILSSLGLGCSAVYNPKYERH